MYAKLQISSTATAAQVVTDIVAVLTGTTDVNELSAQIVKANSQIISTDPAGWTLVGDYLTTGKVLSAPVADNASQYKYVAIFTSGTSVAYQLGEEYNAGGKTLTTAYSNGVTRTDIKLCEQRSGVSTWKYDVRSVYYCFSASHRFSYVE